MTAIAAQGEPDGESAGIVQRTYARPHVCGVVLNGQLLPEDARRRDNMVDSLMLMLATVFGGVHVRRGRVGEDVHLVIERERYYAELAYLTPAFINEQLAKLPAMPVRLIQPHERKPMVWVIVTDIRLQPDHLDALRRIPAVFGAAVDVDAVYEQHRAEIFVPGIGPDDTQAAEMLVAAVKHVFDFRPWRQG